MIHFLPLFGGGQGRHLNLSYLVTYHWKGLIMTLRKGLYVISGQNVDHLPNIERLPLRTGLAYTLQIASSFFLYSTV